MFFGFIFLIFGSVGGFVVPYYVGKVINALHANQIDLVNQYCLNLFIIVCVSL